LERGLCALQKTCQSRFLSRMFYAEDFHSL
jgi:hypothetical protein